jgi:hypothetical protein
MFSQLITTFFFTFLLRIYTQTLQIITLMSVLEDFIGHMNPSEIKGFRWSQRHLEKDSMELQLFDYLVEHPMASRDELMNLFYEKNKRDALDQLRKKLIKKLYTYIVTELIQDEDKAQGVALGQMILCHEMAGRKAVEVVKHFMNRAEKKALDHRLYTILDVIYHFQNQQANFLNISLEELSEKEVKNNQINAKIRKLDGAITSMSIKLQKMKQKGEVLDPDEIIREVSRDLLLEHHELNNPAFQLRIVALFRSAIVSLKDYMKLEPMLLRIYRTLKESNAFSKGDQMRELLFLYMLSHTYYRNFNFGEAEKWHIVMGQMLPSGAWINLSLFLKYTALEAAIAAATGRNELAIEIVEKIHVHRPEVISQREWHNLELSLSVYYFNASDYRKSTRLLNDMQCHAAQMEEWMGKEWCFKLDMIQLIALYEYGKTELAVNHHARMRKRYAGFLKDPAYDHAGVLLRMVGRIVRNADVTKTTRFQNDVKKAWINREEWQYDIQAVAFFCWLKSKLLSVAYYSLLTQELRRLSQGG